MEKGQVCRMAIEDISSEGQGVGRIDGMAVFVPEVVWGDEVEVEITKVKKNYAFAKLAEVISPSKYRVSPKCVYAGQCGGCRLANMSYEGQLALKEKQVRDKLERLAGLDNPKINPIISMENTRGYRNKASMPISCGGIITRKGGIVENLGPCSIGFYGAKSHDVVNCDECLIQAPAAVAIAGAVKRFVKEDNITAYDSKWEKGLLRHLVVKTAFGTGEVMAILVVNGKGIPNAEKLIGMMDEAIYNLPERADGICYNLESVVLNVNKKNTSEIMGNECITIAGKPTILETVGGMSFEISPLSFYQVNHEQMEKLYSKAVEYAGLTGNETVLDLYCGVGTIGLFCAAQMNKKAGGIGGRVIGIESVKGAVADANRNAVINNIVNAEFVCGKAEEVLPRLLNPSLEETASVEEGLEDDGQPDPRPKKDEREKYSITSGGAIKPDVIILDPPRAGCAPELLQAAAQAAPDRIVYISCDPATLARDIKILCGTGEDGGGYEFVEATPVDMFAETGHVETAVLLVRKP